MDYIDYIDDTENHPKNRPREILKSYGPRLAILIFIIYIILQLLFTNAFFSRIMIVNIPQTTSNTAFGFSYQYPQGPAQQTITQLEPNVVSTGTTAAIIGSILIWAVIAIAAFVLLKLLGKSPGWSLVSAVGCSILAFIPFLIISIVLMSTMPVYTVDYSAAVSHPTESLLDGFNNDAHMQLVEPIMSMGWICFGILCIFTIKVSEDLNLRQALIAVGIPVFLTLVVLNIQHIMAFLHYFI